MTETPQAPEAPAPAPAPAGPGPNPGKGLSIAGMVLGIVAVVVSCIFYVSIPCAVVGLILSIMGKKKSKAANAPTGAATAGIVLSIIGLVLGVIVGIFFGAAIIAAIKGTSELQQQIQDANVEALLGRIRMF